MRKFNLWVQLQQSENISKSTLRVKMSKHNFLRLECTKKKSSTFRKKIGFTTYILRLFGLDSLLEIVHFLKATIFQKKSHKILIEL